MSKRKLNDFEICAMARQMLSENKTCAEIAKIYNVSDYTAYYYLVRNLVDLDKYLFLQIKRLLMQHSRPVSEEVKTKYYETIDEMLRHSKDENSRFEQCRLKI